MNEARKFRRAQERAQAKLDRKAGEHLKDNRCWAEVWNINAQCDILLRNYSTVAAAINNRTLLAYVKDPKTLSNEIRVLAADLRSLNDQLREITSLHADRANMIDAENAEDAFRAYDVYEKYVQFLNVHEGTITPVYNSILDKLRQAEHLMTEDAKSKGVEDQAVLVKNIIRSDIQEMREVAGVHTLAEPVGNMTPAQDPSTITDVSYSEAGSDTTD